jgi:hypothetical protein
MSGGQSCQQRRAAIAPANAWERQARTGCVTARAGVLAGHAHAAEGPLGGGGSCGCMAAWIAGAMAKGTADGCLFAGCWLAGTVVFKVVQLWLAQRRDGQLGLKECKLRGGGCALNWALFFSGNNQVFQRYRRASTIVPASIHLRSSNGTQQRPVVQGPPLPAPPPAAAGSFAAGGGQLPTPTSPLHGRCCTCWQQAALWPGLEWQCACGSDLPGNDGDASDDARTQLL